MKKFLLVILIGMVLAINVYGLVNEFMNKQVKEVDHIEETTTMVYVEQLMLFLLFFRTLYKGYYERKLKEGLS